jgi:hypothetical protein
LAFTWARSSTCAVRILFGKSNISRFFFPPSRCVLLP